MGVGLILHELSHTVYLYFSLIVVDKIVTGQLFFFSVLFLLLFPDNVFEHLVFILVLVLT